MPLCPYCRTVVTEDAQFCPECGRRLAVGEVVERRSKKKLVGIIAACIAAVIVIVVIATRPPAAVKPEPTIPAHFETYTDESGLFTISYPPGWELALEYLEDVEQATKDIMDSIESGLSTDVVHFVFLAGLPTVEGYDPSVSVVVAPCPTVICTHDAMIRAEIEGMKATDPGYLELSRVTTTVGGRTATILISEGTFPDGITYQYVQMFLLVGRTEWCVTCGALPDDYGEWKDDFDAVVRSLRILK